MARLYWSLRSLMAPLKVSGGAYSGVTAPMMPEAAERLELLLGAGAVEVEGVEVAEDELDGLEQAARRLALPRLAEAAAAERFDQAVAGERFAVRLAYQTHVQPLLEKDEG